MSNISALRAIAELNKMEAARNENTEVVVQENKPKFSLFGFGFRSSAAEEVPPEDGALNLKT